ncbi:Alpha-ketoglutarate-dependent 2,4-dichlorophenoxyacetate dioxygenase [Cladobotryum mycophilum]|uniref:Alpha-ketoglutarate-dependent 2,4-dichlorophenoxyacetate dioxygenase n=1 Tax=Cladobotryum mycophilum TaxID=491253 RepID=A0ABR0STU1_9HYPO
MAPILSPTLSFKALHPSFGAECRGVDFSRPLSEQTISNIRAGMAKYGVLVFRRTELGDASQVAFARQLGELDVSSAYSLPGQKHRLTPNVELTDVSNIENGEVSPTDSLRSKIAKGNDLFHVDCSYNARRAGYSILRAHQLPPRGTGGATAFADTRAAYKDLDDKTKLKIKDCVLAHSLLHSRGLAAPECVLFQMAKLTDFSIAHHKLAQLHEPSGRMNLYIAAHAYNIDGMEEEQSQPIIRDLLQHASQDKYTFKVDWENNGDVIIWDNTCVMHKACGGDFEGKYVRDMRRATVYDSSSSAWGLNEAAVQPT